MKYSIDNLPDPARMAPLIAQPMSKAGDNWPVAYQTGNSGSDGDDWCIQTDNVRASAFMDLDFPADAKDDAEAIVAIINAYRAGRLVPASTERTDIMDICKFQTEGTGKKVLIYNEDRSVFAETDNPEFVHAIKEELSLGKLSKAYATAELTPEGKINIGKIVADQNW